MSHALKKVEFTWTCLGKLSWMHDVAHDEANDTDDQDDGADRDNHDPLSRNEYPRPVILPTPPARAWDHEFLWLTFPRVSPHLNLNPSWHQAPTLSL